MSHPIVRRLALLCGTLVLWYVVSPAGAQDIDVAPADTAPQGDIEPADATDAPPEGDIEEVVAPVDGRGLPPAEVIPFEEEAEALDIEAPMTPPPVSPADVLDTSAEPELEERLKPIRTGIESKPIDIFDPGEGENLTPIQRAALSMAERQAAVRRRGLADIQHLATYEFEMSGRNEEEILLEATVQSLKAAAGQLYFGNYYLLGLDLLEPYLRRHGRPFIASTEVLERRFLPEDLVWVHLRISVNLDDFYNDLKAKQFLAEPNLLPNVGVMVHEIVEGKPDPSGRARSLVERTLEENLLLTYTERIQQIDLNTDATATPALLRQARLETQRQNIDVLITGTVTVRPIREGEIYYDRYNFREADAQLNMYRVDNGDLLMSLHERYSAAGGTAEDAMNAALSELLVRMTQKMSDHLRVYWTATMAYKGEDYRLLVKGVEPRHVAGIYGLLQALDPEIKVFQKSFYGNVLVLNVVLPDRVPVDLENYLRNSKQPQFVVRRVGNRGLQLEII